MMFHPRIDSMRMSIQFCHQNPLAIAAFDEISKCHLKSWFETDSMFLKIAFFYKVKLNQKCVTDTFVPLSQYFLVKNEKQKDKNLAQKTVFSFLRLN